MTHHDVSPLHSHGKSTVRSLGRDRERRGWGECARGGDYGGEESGNFHDSNSLRYFDCVGRFLRCCVLWSIIVGMMMLWLALMCVSVDGDGRCEV